MQQSRTNNVNNNAHRDAWSVWEDVWSNPASRHQSRGTHTTTPAAENGRPFYSFPPGETGLPFYPFPHNNNNTNINEPEYPPPWDWDIVGSLYNLYFLYIWYYYAPSGAFFEFLWSIIGFAFKVGLVGVGGYLCFQGYRLLKIIETIDPNEPFPPRR